MRRVNAANHHDNAQVYHTDGLGSVRAITDASGNVVQTYQTDPFGVPTQTHGSNGQPFQFTGQQQDGDVLVYLRARMYDPTIGRFLSRDLTFGSPASPLSLNRYSYALNNPVALVDPSGLSTSRVTRDGSTDNACFSSGNGLLQGDVFNVACLNLRVGVVGFSVVQVGPTRIRLMGISFATSRPGDSCKLQSRNQPGAAEKTSQWTGAVT